ncbi:hypothetical protein [Acidovorax sp.]|uniref:hypothetical protein n=1 Tax=Acidovorax sp. TaxID=1872122 RepID=UPI00391F6787
MPLEFLRAISVGPFPLELTGQAELDKLRVLAAADMVEAELPEVGKPAVAVVRRITGYGRAALAASPPHGLRRPAADRKEH